MGKTIVYAGATVGSFVGGYLPVVLFHAAALGLASLGMATVGGFLGLWLGYKAYQSLDI